MLCYVNFNYGALFCFDFTIHLNAQIIFIIIYLNKDRISTIAISVYFLIKNWVTFTSWIQKA